MSPHDGPAPGHQPAAPLLGKLLAGPAVGLVAMFTLFTLPPWDRASWPGGIALVVGVGGLLLPAPLTYRRARAAASAPACAGASVPAAVPSTLPFRVQPRGWLLIVSAVLLFGCAVYSTLVGQQVIAAASLGPHPAQTSAVRVLAPRCSKCDERVQYQVGGTLWTATPAGDIGGVEPCQILVYDPAHPSRVMTAASWSAGRGTARWVLLGVVLAAAGWTLLWAGLGRRRRRRLGTLRPDIPIVGAHAGHGRYGVTWRVSFADAERVTYGDSVALRHQLSDRLQASGALETPSEADRTLLPTDTPPAA